MRIGILGTSDIAFRRFLPALKNTFDFAGVASRDVAKTVKFIKAFGGKGYNGYDALLDDENIDCVYIPLPPALHFEWAKKALLSGKHVMLEKPFTTSMNDTHELVELAERKNLALHENYMFQYHSQIDFILTELGELRLIRLDFGFPFRGAADFRYNKALGGGALFDCGGYTVKLASILLGDTARFTDATLIYKEGFEVDIGGTATLRNSDGLTAQIAFGMDNGYRCSLDVWGRAGSLFTDRVFTAPDGFSPTVIVKIGNDVKEYKLEVDNSFEKSIAAFDKALNGTKDYSPILKQAELIEQFKELNQQ